MKTASSNKYKKADTTDKFSPANDPLGLERFFFRPQARGLLKI